MLDWMPKWFGVIPSMLAFGFLGFVFSFKHSSIFGRWECVIGGACLGLVAGLIVLAYDLALGRDDNQPEVDGDRGACKATEADKEGNPGVFSRWFGG